MINKARPMDPGEWFPDAVEEDLSHMREWNVENETEESLQNRCEYNGRDEEDFTVPDEQSEDVEGNISSDDSDCELTNTNGEQETKPTYVIVISDNESYENDKNPMFANRNHNKTKIIIKGDNDESKKEIPKA